MNRRDLLCSLAAFGATNVGAPVARAARADEALMTDAFDYAYPLFEFARAAQRAGGTTIEAPADRLNRIFHRRTLADHTSRQVTSPNNDTVYSSAFLELSGGPMELIAPTVTDRYFSIAFMDAFTDNFHYIGTRATGGQGGRYWIVGPDAGDVSAMPADARIIRAATNDVWMLGRVLVTGPQDLAAANAVQDTIRLTQLSGRGPNRPVSTPAIDGSDGMQVLAVANEMLGRQQTRARQLQRARRFRRLGVRPVEANAPETAPPDLRVAWEAAGRSGIPRLRAAFSDPGPVRNGWTASSPAMGNFGDNDRLRAAVALGGIAALGREEAMYFAAVQDAAGAPLAPGGTYRMRLPARVPVEAFWSITMYAAEPDGRFFFVDNPLHRYSIGDRTAGLVRDADGGVTIHLSETPPTDGNWLPTPSGPFRVSFRAYVPKTEMRDGHWRPPPLLRAY